MWFRRSFWPVGLVFYHILLSCGDPVSTSAIPTLPFRCHAGSHNQRGHGTICAQTTRQPLPAQERFFSIQISRFPVYQEPEPVKNCRMESSLPVILTVICLYTVRVCQPDSWLGGAFLFLMKAGSPSKE